MVKRIFSMQQIPSKKLCKNYIQYVQLCCHILSSMRLQYDPFYKAANDTKYENAMYRFLCLFLFVCIFGYFIIYGNFM